MTAVARVPWWERATAAAFDLGMCAVINALQWRHPATPADREALERYIAHCETLSREVYFSAPAPEGDFPPDAPFWTWRSPVATAPLRACAHETNDRVRVDLYPGPDGWAAPTVLLLHALMSASDIGYRAWARRFHRRGWNACFVHLPYHYSRTPPGFINGELAITADLVRTGEGLRAGVAELRQVLALLRALGTREFGLWATSYGGWIGALLTFLESDFRWAALMTPILNVEHAIWESLSGVALRGRLRRAGIGHALVERHAHLTSPREGRPLCGGERIVFGAGQLDRIAPPGEINALADAWGSERIAVAQGHFGYRLMPAMFDRLTGMGWV